MLATSRYATRESRREELLILFGVRWPGTALVKLSLVNRRAIQSGAGPPHSKEASSFKTECIQATELQRCDRSALVFRLSH